MYKISVVENAPFIWLTRLKKKSTWKYPKTISKTFYTKIIALDNTHMSKKYASLEHV